MNMEQLVYRVVVQTFGRRGASHALAESLGIEHATPELARQGAIDAGYSSFYVCDQNGKKASFN